MTKLEDRVGTAYTAIAANRYRAQQPLADHGCRCEYYGEREAEPADVPHQVRVVGGNSETHGCPGSGKLYRSS